MKAFLGKKKILPALFTVVLFIISGFCAFAQDSEWYMNKPIKGIQFQGLTTLKQSDLDGVTSSFIGKEFTDDVFADLLNRVFALNYFDDIEPQAVPGDSAKSSVKIILKVKESPCVSRVEFRGNSQIRSTDLKDVVSIKEKDIFSESKVLIDERAIRDLYIEKGYTAVKVSSVSTSTPSGVSIVFNISEGRQTVVAQILFEGNALVSEKTLKSKLTLKEVSLINKGSFQESALEQDRKTIIAYYQNRGYVDANVVDVKKTSSFNEEKQREELTVTFVIQEGGQYKFGGITFTGNKVFTTEQLNALVKLRPDELFNATKLQESFNAIQTLYFENGYTANEFYPEAKKDPDSRTISYTLRILEHVRSHIDQIIVKGNTQTKEDVILREIPITEGDIFSQTKILNGLRNLYNLQYFSTVYPEVTAGSEENLVDIVFNVEEQSTTSLDFGFTFSGVSDPDEFPVALFATITDSNLFGEGHNVSASLNLSTDSQSAKLSYGNNWLFGMPISTSISLGYGHEKEYTLIDQFMPDGTIDDDSYYLEYENHDVSISFGMGRRWTPDFAIITASGGISGSLINNIYDPSLYIPVDSSISDYNNNWEPKNSIWASLSLDGRDNNFDPSSGWFASERLSWYGLLPEGAIPFAKDWGETQFFLRSETKLEGYYTFLDIPVSETWNFKLSGMAYTGFSAQVPAFGSTIKKSNQLYIDGMFSGRGWYVYNIKRGQAMWNNTLELRWPIVSGVVAADFFADASMIKPDMESVFTDFANKDDWYFSFGPGIRVCLPQLPLRFIWASTFQFDDNGIVWENKYGNTVQNFWDSVHFILSINLVNK